MGRNIDCAINFKLGAVRTMLTESEIPKIGNIYDRIGHALIILNENLEINYFNHSAEAAVKKINADNFTKKWKSIPGKVSQKRVFFLVNKDVTCEEEIWVRMQIENGV